MATQPWKSLFNWSITNSLLKSVAAREGLSNLSFQFLPSTLKWSPVRPKICPPSANTAVAKPAATAKFLIVPADDGVSGSSFSLLINFSCSLILSCKASTIEPKFSLATSLDSPASCREALEFLVAASN